MHVIVNNVGIDEFWMEAVVDATWTSIFPYQSHVVLEGAALVEDHGFDVEVAAAILARAAKVDPRLAAAEVVGRQVGWRPTRATPRVEFDRCRRNGLRARLRTLRGRCRRLLGCR